MVRKIDPPNTVQIELTEGCNLMCQFCGVNGIRSSAGNFNFMNEKTIKIIKEQLETLNCRLLFAMHGEPTFNKNMVNFINMFEGKSIALLTNGANLKKHLSKLLNSNVPIIIGIDDYLHNKNSKILKALLNKENIEYHEYPKEKGYNPHNIKISKTVIIFLQDIKLRRDVKINSHCGAGTRPPVKPIEARCAKPFREISIRWDGNVSLCCNDFRGVYKIGNVNEKNIIELWESEKFESARKMLYHKNRNFSPCKYCNATSFRVGLLPDRMGKQTMDMPNEKDLEIINTCISGEPFSNINFRNWEKINKCL